MGAERLRLRLLLALVVVAGAGVLAGSVAVLVSDGGTTTRPPGGSYAEKIIEARRGLFQGRLAYTDIEKATAGDSQSFSVTVSGDDLPPPTRSPDPTRSREIPVGATIGARFHCSGAGATCTANSSERQSVLTRGDSAVWHWTVETPSAGEVTTALTVTVYYRNTTIVLAEPRPVIQTVEVEDDRGFLDVLGGFWQWLIGLLTAVGGLGGFIAFLDRRRRTRHTTGSPAAGSAQGPGGPAPENDVRSSGAPD